MLGQHLGERRPEPGARCFAKGGKQSEEIPLVTGPDSTAASFDLCGGEMPAGLVEENNFRGSSGQPPSGLPGAGLQRDSDATFPVQDQILAGESVQQELELEGAVGQRRRRRERAAEPGDVDVGGQVEPPTVPQFGGVVRDVRVVADQRPSREVLEDGALVVVEDRDVDVQVIARLPAQPSVGGPPAAENPPRSEAEEQLTDVRYGLRHGRRRLGRRKINHPGQGARSLRGAQLKFAGTVGPVSGRAIDALTDTGITFRVIRHGPVSSLAEAARARGVDVVDVVKTIVVRRADNDFVFVLVPGGRVISWPKLRALLGVNRLSMPDAGTAKAATGYERGTITPFGSTTAWPVIADERLRGRPITLGGGEHGVAVAVAADDAFGTLDATLADVTDPDPSTSEGTGPG